MNKKLFNPVLFVIALIAGIVYGIIIHKYEVFPYGIIKKASHSLIRTEQVTDDQAIKEQSPFYDLWSIGIFEGPTPFDLAAPEDVSNPVITAKDVVDIDASYVADPFMMIKDGKYYLFFEAFNWETYQGDIGYAESTDGYHWEYQKIIIDETFHLSYPYIFKWNDDYYLIPESHEDLSVRLYKAVSFPDQWEYIGNLIAGYHYVDPSIFRYNDKWWLFVATTPDDGVMNLYYSNNLLGDWRLHPMNPIVKLDNHIARPAGRVFTYNDHSYRIAQDSYTEYGLQVFAFEITELTEKSYAEKVISDKPIVTKSGKGWNAAGMHHVDLHKIGNKWIGAVDGKKYGDINNKSLKQVSIPKVH